MVVKIDKLDENTKNETIVVKILSLTEKETKSEKGEGVYHYGLIGDETGTMPYTAWALPATIRQGDVVELRNFSVKKYNDSLRLYLDTRTDVILRPEDKMDVKRVYKEYKIKNLTLKDQYVSVSGKITDVIEKKYEKDGQQKDVSYCSLEDDTGSIRLSLFEVKIKPDKFYRLEGLRVSEFKGRLRLSGGDRTKILEIKAFDIPERKIFNIFEVTGPVDSITLTGFVVYLGEKGGLVRRCSECRKSTDDIKCPEHPDAEMFLDLYAYFTLEDGTGDSPCTAGRTPLMDLLNIKDEDLNLAKPKYSKNDIITKIEKALMPGPLSFTGDASSGSNGISFRVRKIQKISEPELRLYSQLPGDEIL